MKSSLSLALSFWKLCSCSQLKFLRTRQRDAAWTINLRLYLQKSGEGKMLSGSLAALEIAQLGLAAFCVSFSPSWSVAGTHVHCWRRPGFGRQLLLQGPKASTLLVCELFSEMLNSAWKPELNPHPYFIAIVSSQRDKPFQGTVQRGQTDPIHPCAGGSSRTTQGCVEAMVAQQRSN